MWLSNRISTPDGTILESKHRHDFVTYIDKNNKMYGVDGGHDYLKRTGDSDYTELSVEDDGNFETRRNNLKWGRNYDKDMKPLNKTEYVSIPNLHVEHIKAILTKVKELDPVYRETLVQELKYRSDKGTVNS